MTKVAMLLSKNVVDVFAQRDDASRMIAIGNLWADQCELRTNDGIFVGRDLVCKHIGELLHRCPECDFVSSGEINEVAGAAWMPWAFKIRGQMMGFTGADVIILREEQIALVCRFLNGPIW